MAPGLNSLLVAALPLLPRKVVRRFARRYVAGETEAEALAVVRELNGRGYETTIDILGENVQTHAEAAAVTAAYVRLYSLIAERGLRCNISLKPTHLGLALDREACRENLLRVLAAARETGNFLRIDMENSPYTDDTLALYRTCLQHYPRVGPVLQAYLHRSRDDLADLVSPSLNFRLCKGIYREPPEVALQDREAINRNFLALLWQAFEEDVYVGIATHDRRLIDRAVALAQERAVPQDRLEFQVLYGVPMDGKLRALTAAGYRVRIYVPFGLSWYDYSLRRLQENPHIAGYVLKNLFRRE